METRKTKTDYILIVMNVLTWIVFIGLMVQAGAILFSYGVSMINPGAAKNLYMKWDMSALMQFSYYHYSVAVLLIVLLNCMKAFAAYLVIKILSGIKLSNPFTSDTAKSLERLSYFLLATWCLVVVINLHSSWLAKEAGIHQEQLPGEIIFFAGMVFIISQIFKKGIEMQSENELTI